MQSLREVTACSSRVTAACLAAAWQLPVLQTSLLWVALAQHVGVTEPVAVPGCCWVGCWPLCCPALLTCMATPVVQWECLPQLALHGTSHPLGWQVRDAHRPCGPFGGSCWRP